MEYYITKMINKIPKQSSRLKYQGSKTLNKTKSIPNKNDFPEIMRITIYESELQKMAIDTVKSGLKEIGGTIFGFRNDKNDPSIMLIGPAGPNSIQESAYFSQDLEYFNKSQEILYKNYDLYPLGNAHYHPFPSMDHPSYTDAAHSQKILDENNLPNWIQIISTRPEMTNNRFSLYSRKKAKLTECSDIKEINESIKPRVKISAYIYEPDSNAIPKEVTLNILPRISPFRLAIAREGILDGVDADVSFPMSCIDVKTEQPTSGEDEFPPSLLEQCNNLPIKIKKDISYVIENSHIILTLPVTEKSKICIAYDSRDMPLFQSVFWLQGNGEDPLDATDQFHELPPNASVRMIYRKSLSFFENRLCKDSECKGYGGKTHVVNKPNKPISRRD
jgi:hypothetical protein